MRLRRLVGVLLRRLLMSGVKKPLNADDYEPDLRLGLNTINENNMNLLLYGVCE